MSKVKLNLKFLLFSLLVSGLVLGGGAALWLFAIHRNPGRYESQGDAAVARGDYRHAVAVYGRALQYVRQPQRKAALLLKTAEAFQNLPVKNLTEGFYCFQNALTLYEKALELQPDNQAVVARLLGYSYQSAREADSEEAWQKLQAQAERALKAMPASVEALKFRALAQVELGTRQKVDAATRMQTRRDLTAALQQQPADSELGFALARCALDEARGAKDAGVAATLRQEALQVVRRQAAAPSAPTAAQLNVIRVMLELAAQTDDVPQRQAAMTLAAELETRLLAAGDQPENARLLAGLLATTDRERGVQRAAALVSAVLKRDPANLDALVDLAGLLRYLNRPEEALPLYEKAMAEQAVTVSASLLKIRNLQYLARFQFINLKLERAEPLPRTATWQQQLADIKVGFDSLRKERPGAPGVDYLEARLALLEEDLWKAAGKAESADTKFERRNPDAALLSGRILSRLGLNGAAVKRLQAVLALPEASPEVRRQATLELVPNLVRLQQFDAASQRVQALPRSTADEQQRSRLLMAEIQAATARVSRTVAPERFPGQLTEAINLLKPLVDADVGEGVRRQAALLVLKGEADQARELLQHYAERHPEDPGTLRDLFAIAIARRNIAGATALLTRLLPPRITNEPAVLLRQALAAPDELLPRANSLLELALDEDPVRRQVGLIRLEAAAGRVPAAVARLAQAATDTPQAPAILAARFDLAMDRGDWAAARQVVADAEKARLPTAELRFWEGQVAIAQGRFAEAIARLGLAVNERPQYVEALALLATASRQAGDLGNAGNWLSRALEQKPDYLPALQEAFLLNDALGETAKALDYLRQAVIFYPDNDRLFMSYLDYLGRNGDRQQALAIRRTLATKSPANQANRLAIAQLYMDLQQPAAAKDILAPLLSARPDDLAVVSAMASYELQTQAAAAGEKRLRDYLARRGVAAGVADHLALARYLRQTGQTEPALAAYTEALSRQEPAEAAVTLELADWYVANRQFDMALPLYREALQRTGNPQLWQPVIDALLRLNKLTDAQEGLASWQKSAPRDSRMAICEARILGAAGKLREARDAIAAALRTEPNNAALYLARVQILAGDSAPETRVALKADLDKALLLSPALGAARELLVDWLWREGRFNEAEEQLNQLLRKQPDNPAYRQQLARLLHITGKGPALERLLKDTASRFPAMPLWHQLLADAYQQQGRPADAVAELALAYALAPGPGALGAYALALIGAQAPEKALAELSKQAADVEASALLMAVRARARYALKQNAQGATDFDRAFTLAAGKPQLSLDVARQVCQVADHQAITAALEARASLDSTGAAELALVETYASDGQVDRAVPRLETLSRRLPPDSPLRPPALWLLGNLYARQRLFLPACEAYEALLKLEPDHGAALNNLACIRAEELNQADQALPLAEKAAALAPADELTRANVLDTLGRVQFLVGKLSEAEVTLQNSIKSRRLPANQLHLAEVLLARQRVPEATAALTLARQLAAEQGDKETLLKIAKFNAALLKADVKPREPTP